jgi:hypothetical protein
MALVHKRGEARRAKSGYSWFMTNNKKKPRSGPKELYRVRNWAVYDSAVVNQWALTIWFSQEAIKAWQEESVVDPLIILKGSFFYNFLAHLDISAFFISGKIVLSLPAGFAENPHGFFSA